VLHDVPKNKKTPVGGPPSTKDFHHQKGVFIMTNLSNAALHAADPTAAEGGAGVYVASFEDLRMTDVESVGGKNASLGEMISQLAHAGVRVPGGFATTAQAFRDFLRHSADGGPSLGQRIEQRLESLDVDDVRALAAAGAEIRQWIVETPFQPRLQEDIRAFYDRLVAGSDTEVSFAVRS
jgi:pyruvate,water dikinase